MAQSAQPLQSSTGALRVFLSSTSVDLEPYRTRVASLIETGFSQFAVTMDHFPLQPKQDATTVSLDHLRASQVYILLLAWRYGHVPDGQALSVTIRSTEKRGDWDYLASFSWPNPPPMMT